MWLSVNIIALFGICIGHSNINLMALRINEICWIFKSPHCPLFSPIFPVYYENNFLMLAVQIYGRLPSISNATCQVVHLHLTTMYMLHGCHQQVLFGYSVMSCLNWNIPHYDDVTWTSCSLKSSAIRPFFYSLCAPTPRKHQIPNYWSFVRGIHRWP